MATSYSTNLALTLQGTGDNPGTWGNITNTNLGTLIEQAISGYEVQALTSGTTLTLAITNGASSVARNMYLEFTGNGSTVIVPSNKKLYFVYNNCSSGTITFKVAGQTGVTIPNGSKQILVSNGTDIVPAASYVSTTSTPTNGQLLIGNGTGFALSTLTAGSNVSITNSAGSITISSSGLTGITGSSNTALGVAALDSVTTSLDNVGIGVDALTSNNSGGGNTALGYKALEDFTNQGGGSPNAYTYNTGLGYGAGKNITSGYVNTMLGGSTGGGITTGAFNTALGFESYNTGNHSNSTCVGASSAVDGSNQVQAGDSSTTVYYYAATVRASDARDKADIQDTTFGLDFIMKLRPRMYRWDYREDYRPKKPNENASDAEWAAWQEACKLSNLTHDGTHKRTRFHHGLIAQEVKQVIDEMGVDFSGYQDFKVAGGDDRLTIVYNELITPMIKAIQELKAEFDEYKRTHP